MDTPLINEKGLMASYQKSIVINNINTNDVEGSVNLRVM
jgi:hypothetical protein